MIYTTDKSYQNPSAVPVLVTGGCGFIGRHLVPRLLSLGHHVTILDNLSTGRLENLPVHPNLDFIEGSILDEDALDRASEKSKLVFHLASVVGMQQVHKDQELTYQTSVTGTANVLKATADAPIVLFSSSAVYGLDSQGESHENRAISDDLPMAYDGKQRGYALGKWKMDLMGQQAAMNGRRVMVVRPFNVIGAGQSDAYGMVLPRFIEQALSNEHLTIFDDGFQSRCFSCVDRFLDCLLRLIDESRAWQPSTNVINVGSKDSTSINQLAQIVLEETRSSSPLRFIPYKQVFFGKKDVRERIPDIRRLEELIGPVEWPDIQTIVRRTVQEYMIQRNMQESQFKFGINYEDERFIFDDSY